MNLRKRALILICLAVWILSMLFFLVRQLQEEIVVSDYLAEHQLQDLPISRKSAIANIAAVRRDFQDDKSKFVFLDLVNRPFLRETVGALITHREGLCDAGKKVIVNLLAKQGYDATRVTLYKKNLESIHTLVSVDIGGWEFLVDSMGSPSEMTSLTIEKKITPQVFNVLHNSDDIWQRRAFSPVIIGDDEVAFFGRYWLYSYEALPVTKILTRLGIDMRVFNLWRPPALLSVIAEKPYV